MRATHPRATPQKSTDPNLGASGQCRVYRFVQNDLSIWEQRSGAHDKCCEPTSDDNVASKPLAEQFDRNSVRKDDRIDRVQQPEYLGIRLAGMRLDRWHHALDGSHRVGPASEPSEILRNVRDLIAQVEQMEMANRIAIRRHGGSDRLGQCLHCRGHARGGNFIVEGPTRARNNSGATTL